MYVCRHPLLCVTVLCKTDCSIIAFNYLLIISRDRNTNLTKGESLVSPTSVGCSLAECDRHRDSIPSTPCFEDEPNKTK